MEQFEVFRVSPVGGKGLIEQEVMALPEYVGIWGDIKVLMGKANGEPEYNKFEIGSTIIPMDTTAELLPAELVAVIV